MTQVLASETCMFLVGGESDECQMVKEEENVHICLVCMS